MRKTNILLGLCFAFFLVCALSMSNHTYLLISLIIALSWLFAYISVWQTERSIRVECVMSSPTVNRGDTVHIDIRVFHRGFLPIAPIALHMRATSNTPAGIIYLKNTTRKQQHVTHTFRADHVGAMFPGVESYVISDIFGFFKRNHTPDTVGQELLVLPVPFETEPLTFAAGDLGVETMKRAMEDPSSPSDFRTYQQGDPLKRIHWKMSARKRELMVRQFEEPALPDALVLLDTSPPLLDNGLSESSRPFLYDTLLETTASITACQIRLENQVRIPFVGDRPMEYSSRMGLPVLLEELARCTFNETEQFERVVMMQLGEMRKVGAVVIITTRLTAELTDLLIRMKRLGPNVRVYNVTYFPENEATLPQINKLQHCGIEVCYAVPQPASASAS